MKKASNEMLEMHSFFEKYKVPLDERIEILKILKSGDELFVRFPAQNCFKGQKEEYVYLLREKLGPLEFSFKEE